MSEKGRTIFIFLLAQLFILTASTTPAFQFSNELKVSVRKAVPAPIEPLRAINGQMQGRTVAGQFVRNGKPTSFSLTITRAEVVGAKLELLGAFQTGPGSRSTRNIRAKIAGSMSMAANPWPHASDSDETPDNISGCGVLFLSLELPSHSRAALGVARPVQVGVVLAPLDNKLGEEINKRICAITHGLDGRSDTKQLTAALADLNSVLAK